MKPTKYDKDNILGWSEEDFAEIICEMVNVKVANNLPLTPLENLYYGHYGDEYRRKKLGITKETLINDEINMLEEKLNKLKEERKCYES